MEIGIFRSPQDKTGGEQFLVIQQASAAYLAEWYHVTKVGTKLGVNKFTWVKHLAIARRFFLRDRPLAETFVRFIRMCEGVETNIIQVDGSRLISLAERAPITPKTPARPKEIRIELRTQKKQWDGL